ncbi:hypothetical protein TNCV_3441571 [Trichonephila clavipes]|uniref:Uncharacterized protein n=1 Tax=Trichonephila clavipes TaxID=2585209 RepID=A0A8X6W5S2_TRICX|nr:hypothetical protein TNCV_3441571 [Trichonephila clavipes]
MALSDSLPQINLGVQGGTQGGSHKVLELMFRSGSQSDVKIHRLIPKQGCYSFIEPLKGGKAESLARGKALAQPGI